MVRFGFLAVILGFLVLAGCEDLPCTKSADQNRIDTLNQTQLQSDIAAIDAYLASKNITAVKDPTGIRYVVKKEGFGGTPCLENQVTFIYKVSLLSNGKEIESGILERQLKDLILAWQVILPQFPKDTKITLYVPSGFAYGASESSSGAIPANSNLIFDIEMTNIR